MPFRFANTDHDSETGGGLGVLLWVVFSSLVFSGCQNASPGPSWHVNDTYRWKELSVVGEGEAGFSRLDSAETGVGFVNHLSQDAYLENRHLVNGSGVAVGDVNGNGRPDLYLTRLEGPNALFYNQGNFQFRRAPDAGGAPLADEYSTGAALTDVTGDGRADLVVTTLGGPNTLYENAGDGQFSEKQVLSKGQGSTTIALGDISGNGLVDLYVANYKVKSILDIMPPEERRFDDVVVRKNGEYQVQDKYEKYYEVERQVTRIHRYEVGETDQVYFNTGGGNFEERPWRSVFRRENGGQIAERPRDWGLVARLEDLNDDGRADLYVCNDFSSPDYYFVGQRDTSTLRRSPAEAIRTTSHSSMSIATTDLTRNGHTDFFVADMLGRTHQRRQQQSGVRTPLPRTVGATTSRMQEMQNTLQVNRGDNTFVETAALANVEASGWTWASAFVDVNLDGYDDLLAANGHAYDAMSADAQIRISSSGADRGPGWRQSLLMYPDLNLKNAAFRNQGDGTFEAVRHGWGLGEEADVSHGMTTADLDQDGDQDVIINRLNDPVGIFENRAKAPRVAIRLVGQGPNTEAIGAEVRVQPEQGAVPPQEKAVIAGGQYLSDGGETLSFAVGAADSVRIETRWPDGQRSVVEGKRNRLYEIRHPDAQVDWEMPNDTATAVSAGFPDIEVVHRSYDHLFAGLGEGHALSDSADVAPDSSRLFEEVSDRLDHTHPENRYPDFKRQPLLPRKLSQQGPGIAWADVSGNGHDDLLIGTGKGGALAFYRNEGNGRFSRIRGNVLDQTYDRDLAGIVAIPKENGAKVIVGQSGYDRLPDEPKRQSRILVFDADANGLERTQTLEFGEGAVGPLAVADVNGDGRLDLFAGGRHIPGKYPASVSSVLFLNEGGTFQRASSRSRVFEDLGLITGAVFADINRDGAIDLLLASEWGPIHYFRNRGNGYFQNRTEEIGLSTYTGLWRGIDVGDFNGDGKIDVVAANWGWNSRYGHPPGAPRDADTPRLKHPLRIYYGDFTRNGIFESIEGHYLPDKEAYVPYFGFSKIRDAMPYVRRRIQSFRQYSTMSIPDIIGARRSRLARTKEASTLSHMVFLNQGTGENRQFEGKALPWWSQMSAGFAPSVGDVDGDGAQDIILSQNFFATEVKTPRQDGGRALWLDGNGDGGFESVRGHESGLIVYGEQRAASLGDMDEDGRIDVVVAQNGAETKLFRNIGATPGIRVRLEGPPGNLRGIGSAVRLRFEEKAVGPATVVRAGSSYWSQHALTPVLGAGDRSVSAVQVQWPGGEQSRAEVNSETRSVTITHPSRR